MFFWGGTEIKKNEKNETHSGVLLPRTAVEKAPAATLQQLRIPPPAHPPHPPRRGQRHGRRRVGKVGLEGLSRHLPEELRDVVDGQQPRVAGFRNDRVGVRVWPCLEHEHSEFGIRGKRARDGGPSGTAADNDIVVLFGRERRAKAGVDFDVGERRGEALGARLGRVLGPGDGCGGVAEGAGERGRERCGDGFCG